jgi:EmrB/QacA subfamily drug resistance transporter
VQRRVLVPLIVASALFMENLDSTVIATALPAIAASLGESPLRLSLAITSYLLSLAVLIPASGWVADRYGARTVLCGGILVFTAGSVLCGLADSLAGFVVARAIQGAGGAMMTPVGRLVLVRSVEKADLVRATAWLTVPALVGPVIGPPLGGFVTAYLSWRWIFWINVPVGVLGLVLVRLFIPDERARHLPPFDGRGFAVLALGLLGLVGGLETVGRGVVPPWATAALVAAGAAAVALYVRHALRAADPVVDLRLLAYPTFRAAVLGGAVFRVGIGAVPFLLPLMLQVGFGLDPFESGLLTFAAAAGALAMKTTAAAILRRLGFRRVLVGNALLSAAFLAAIGALRPETPQHVVLALLLAGGFFRSLQFTSVNTIAYAELPPARVARATSLAAMAQQLSLSLGAATGALALHLATTARGGAEGAPPAVPDFAASFLVAGAVAALSALAFVRLPPDAGAEISGQRPPGRGPGS